MSADAKMNQFDKYLQDTIDSFSPQEREDYEAGNISISVPPEILPWGHGASPKRSPKSPQLCTLRAFDEVTASSILHYAMDELRGEMFKRGLVSPNQIRNAVDRKIEDFIALHIREEMKQK